VNKKTPAKVAKVPGKMVKRVTTVQEFEDNAEENNPDVSNGSKELEFGETDDVRDFAGYDRSLKSYMVAAGGSSEYTADLYKYDIHAKQNQALVYSSEGEMLKAHDVGMMFGSGRYRYLVTFPDNPKIKPKAFRLNIATSYDEMRQKNGLAASVAVPDAGNRVSAGPSGMAESLGLLKEFAAIMKSIMPTPIAPSENFMQLQMHNARQMGEVMKEHMMETSSLYSQIAALNASQGQNTMPNNDDDDDDDKPAGFFEQLLPMAQQFLPLLLGNGPASAVAVQTLKAVPAFQEVTKDKGKLKEGVAVLDKAQGKENTDKILKVLGLRRPA